MKEYKLFKLLCVVEPKELKELKDYIGGIKSSEGVQNLLEILNGFHPNFDNPKLTKEKLFKKLFKNATYDDGRMRKLMTQLSQSVEQFLIMKELNKSEELRVKLLSRALASRSNYSLFLEIVENRLKSLDKESERGRNYFREYYELCDMVYFHTESDKFSNRNEYVSKANINFENYITLVSLQNLANNIVGSRLVKSTSQSQYTIYARQVSEFPGFKESRAIRLFNQIIDLLEGRKEEDLELLKSSAFETFKELSRFEQDFALNLMRNYAVPRSNEGSHKHSRFILDLYKLELDRGFAIGMITGYTFMNIVTIGLTINEFDWIEDFIAKYHELLPINEYERTLNYCQGLWHYHMGIKRNALEGFYLALQFLNKIPIRSNFYFELRVRQLSLRTHFEIFIKGEEFLDDLLNHCRNFERHLTGNNEYSDSMRNSFLEFIRHFKALVRILADPQLNTKNINQFLEKLKNPSLNFAFKPWLLERTKELAEKS